MAGTGGYRPGAGRPRKYRPNIPGMVQPKVTAEDSAPVPRIKYRKPPKMTPLTYMLRVLNDENADPERRDRMALNAAAYVHVKVSDTVEKVKRGKKEVRQSIADEAASTGPYSVPAAPKLVRSN